MSIGIFDPSIGTGNIGDEIIMDSVRKVMDEITPYEFKIFFPTQEKISKISHKKIKIMDFTVVGGTNLLSSNMNKHNQWKINFIDSIYISNAVLFGVGWWQYQDKPNIYTELLYKRILSNTYIHSVRDSFTEQQLKSIGIENVLNTACPTTWSLTKEHCAKISQEKAKDCIFTLTDYMKSISEDKALIDILVRNYDKVYFWVQGSRDIEYFKSLDIDEASIIIVPPSLKDYDRLLTYTDSLDFIGTRLHAGIRALQKGVRSIIVAVDNRAIEKSKDINLKIILRNKIHNDLEEMLNSSFETNILLPEENITLWKKQFSDYQSI